MKETLPLPAVAKEEDPPKEHWRGAAGSVAAEATITSSSAPIARVSWVFLVVLFYPTGIDGRQSLNNFFGAQSDCRIRHPV